MKIQLASSVMSTSQIQLFLKETNLLRSHGSPGLSQVFLPMTEFEEPQTSISTQGAVSDLGAQNQMLGVTGKLSEERKVLSPVKDTVSTVILINSSICTMQRIAVLEDGELVELLLEPVKNNVQCDSVVVTKPVPNMGGAFVNIGNSRHSLMDIKKSKEPFIFPPFSQVQNME
ncbi:hypothetical protein SAY87_031652 [Trapa incisa]|uniref:Uncharacterized protein n=1 Tax=Trapa incisa TaxID=236973 RepID=A0AAN7KQL0_9MYRT|nr:hypothetical protein SAY87_031652 [Trapa incisa]